MSSRKRRSAYSLYIIKASFATRCVLDAESQVIAPFAHRHAVQCGRVQRTATASPLDLSTAVVDNNGLLLKAVTTLVKQGASISVRHH